MHEHTNALIHEQSPYLLQHAHNPVDWHAWNDETLAKARRENRPIFLSIGYSTCHWCHVMAHESFEDPRVAEAMNRYFINVKVDREERPDVDQTYMLAVQAMGQQGGWPLSVWLTPDLKPFYGGTYFPPEARFGRMAFVDVVERIHQVWEADPQNLAAQANRLMDAIAGAVRAAAPQSDLSTETLDAGYMAFHRTFDPEHGGFGAAPKFPRPTALTFLLRQYQRTGDEEALAMTVMTLRAMALGGIHDHLAGGFARYSVDAEWRVPHFEKMLYDQAQLLWAYSQAFQITGLPDLAGAVYDIAGYVGRDMTHPDGGFYSAEDADSVDEHGVSREGAFYAWTLDQLNEALGAESAAPVAAYFGMTPDGNFEHGLNVLHISMTVAELAAKFGVSEDEARRNLQNSLARLLEVRSGRHRPGRDDKILTSWNGLMISALAQAHRATGEPAFLANARRAADFILANMWQADTGVLMRRFRNGHVAVPGFLDDHAFLTLGLLDLYGASLDARYLMSAAEIAGVMVSKFHDVEGGGFLFTPAGGQGLSRRKDDYDGAEPSGGSIAAIALLRLAEMTGNPAFRSAGEGAVRAASGILSEYPEMMPAMLGALDFMLGSPRQVVIAGEDTDEMVRAVQSLYLPNVTLLRADGSPAVSALAPWTLAMSPVGPATAYVCREFACQNPTTDLDVLIASLGARRPPR
ncbi:MAG TPA: thioredoxin domain-containing protein [Armatimonadota bacterium]|jgi:hypothetical protein